MTQIPYRAPSMSFDQINAAAMHLRSSLQMLDVEVFPIIAVMEQILDQKLHLFELQAWDSEEMAGAEGYTDPMGEFIALSERHYIGACQGNRRSRWTAGHELGHWVLHSRRLLARVPDAAFLKPFENPEIQAHQFCAELLAPRHLILRSDTATDIADRFLISGDAAGKRLDFMRRRNLFK
jgi:Zn-dependent peptidase ImmA (M78 family)